jgi:hypothetical protein
MRNVRKTPWSIGIGLAAMIVCAAAQTPALAESWETVAPNPQISIEYRAPATADLTHVYETVKDRKVLEEMQRFLAPLHLPHHLSLVFAQCDPNHDRPDGGVNAWYSPDERELRLCYEYVVDVIKLAPETVSPDGFITREASIVGAIIGTALHESGHMMFNMFDVPVFGREEDAADEMASYMALKFNKDVERTIVKGAVYYWSRNEDPPSEVQGKRIFSDVHGTASQRMYNWLCLAYGADPQTFQEFVDKGWLPKARADHCPKEFAQLKRAFEATIDPFIDEDLMARAAKIDWLTPEELK